MKTPVLIIEDESIVAMEIATVLEYHGYHVVAIVSNAADAITKAMLYMPHIILVDICIKGDVDGIAAASYISNRIDVAIIYLTAYSDECTIDRAIETAPAAYLNKPYRRDDLLSAMKIALMHHKSTSSSNVILSEEFNYNTATQELFYLKERIRLTSRERELLELFIKSKCRIVNIYELENHIWPEKPANESTRRALVSRLRAKLNQQFIETIPGIGYRFNY
jgi:DNA-binding response OmpR family regulator